MQFRRNNTSKAMPGSISIDTLDIYEGSFMARSRRSTHSVDSWTIVTAAANTLYRTSEVDPASQTPVAVRAKLTSQLPDTSADLTRNWLTTTAPPPFSRKGVADVVMPIKADVPRQRKRAQSTSRAQPDDGGQLQPRESPGLQQSEGGGRESEARMTEERTLGWMTLTGGMSTGFSQRRPGLRERKNNGDTHEDTDVGGTITSDEGTGLGATGEGESVEGRKMRRKWPWDSFLKIADKRLKGTL